METLGGAHRGNYEAGGSVFTRIAKGLGEMAHMGAELVKIAVDETPKLLHAETNLIIRHQPED